MASTATQPENSVQPRQFSSVLLSGSTSSLPLPSVLDPWSADAATGNPSTSSADGPAQDEYASENFETVFVGVNLPPEYEDAFAKARPSNNEVSVSTLNKIIGTAGLPAAIAQKIINTVVAPNQARVSRSRFFVTLAFAAFAQKNMDITYENLLAHRTDLPSPSLPYIDSLRLSRDADGRPSARSTPIMRPPSSLEADPWRSSTRISSSSSFILAASPANDSSLQYSISSDAPPTALSATAHRTTQPIQACLTPFSPLVGREALEWLISSDSIAVYIAPERGGVVFKHVKYVVESKMYRSSVLRRYSEFRVLSGILARRHPWRLLPHLPPKKVSMNGAFLERRRKGLARYLNFLVRHPILRTDPSVVMFLTEGGDTGPFRRPKHETSTEEFYSEGERRSGSSEFAQTEYPVVPGLEERVADTHRLVATGLEHFGRLCTVLDQAVMLQKEYAVKLEVFRSGLRTLAEAELARSDCRSCESVYNGLHGISEQVHEASTIMSEHVQSAGDHIVENLRRHRELLVYMKELLDRRERVSHSATLEALARKIAANESLLADISEPNTGDDTGFSAQRVDHSKEVARLKAAIEQDQQEVERHARRQTVVHHCLSHELELFHKSTAFLALAFQQFSEDQTRFTGRVLDVWRNMTTAAYDMPTDLDAFT